MKTPIDQQHSNLVAHIRQRRNTWLRAWLRYLFGDLPDTELARAAVDGRFVMTISNVAPPVLTQGHELIATFPTTPQ